MSLRSRNAVDWAKSALPHRDVDSSRIASWNTPALLPSQRTHVRHTVFPHLNRRFAGACIYPQSSGRTFARCRLEPPGGRTFHVQYPDMLSVLGASWYTLHACNCFNAARSKSLAKQAKAEVLVFTIMRALC